MNDTYPQFGSTYVPPSDFDTYRWLEPARPEWAPRWFYWIIRDRAHEGEFVDLNTVDDLLKPIVALAQDNDIRTFPSCQGHFYSTGDLQDQSYWLQMETAHIRNGLLPFRDVETGTILRPKIANWTYPSSTSLTRMMKRHEGEGRIGFLMDEDLGYAFCRYLHPSIKTRVTGDKVDVMVKADNEKGLVRSWENVEQALRRSL